jgi:DNA-directed RNA polymerase specialized sigma24 family protein
MIESDATIIDIRTREPVVTPEERAFNCQVLLGLTALTELEQDVIFLRYINGHSNSHVADVIGIPPDQAHQIAISALRNLKNEVFKPTNVPVG